MRRAILASLTLSTLGIGSALVVSAQVPSAGDMQQKLDQEMAKCETLCLRIFVQRPAGGQ